MALPATAKADGKARKLHDERGLYQAVARERRDEARKLIADGINPSAQRKARKQAATVLEQNSFERIAREWHARQSPT